VRCGEHLVVEMKHRQSEKLHGMIAAQYAMAVDVNVETLVQRLEVPHPDAVATACLHPIEAGVTETPAARVEDERAVGKELRT